MTSTTATTEPPVEVNPDVLKAVREYLKANEEHQKAELKLESKYWPMIEEALKMVDQGADQEMIANQFRAAFEKATENIDKASRQYISMRLMSTRVAKMALKGRDFIEAEKKAGKGFWKIANELEKAAKQPSATPDVVTSNGDEKAKPSPSLSNRSGSGKRKVKGQPATNVIKIGGGKDDRVPLDVVVDALKVEDTLSLLLESIEELVKTGKIAYIDLITALLEKAQLPMDTLQSLLQPKPKAKKKAKELKSLTEIGLEPKLA